MINPHRDIDITCNNCGDTDILNRIFSVYLQIPENILSIILSENYLLTV